MPLSAEPDSTRPAKRQRAEPRHSLVFYHGTSSDRAQKILAQGFNLSTTPPLCLGPGVSRATPTRTWSARRCGRSGRRESSRACVDGVYTPL